MVHPDTIVSDVPLISRLEKEDSFWAGDFEVEVVSSNGNGIFNGEGIIRIPYFNQVRVNVRLDNVQINEDCQMVAGEVVVLGVGAELLSDELQNALDDLLSTLDDIEDVITVIDEVLTTISDVVNTSSQMGEVLSEDWNVLHGGDPLFDEYPYLPDSLGQQLDEAILCYLVNPPSECSDQLAEVIDAVIAAINEMFEADYALRFNPYEAQSYGFDSLMYDPMASDYNRLVAANQPYNVAWKSVESGMSDHVLLNRDFADLPTDLTFEKNDRSTLQPENDNGKTRLPITGLAHEEVYQIYPVQNKLDENNDPVKKYAGKLNVISYDRKEVEVVLVPVNGAGANLTESDRVTIESSLNDIYQPAVASMTVELETNLTLDWFDGSLDTTGSKFYTQYNSEMRQLIDEIQDLPNYNDDKYYLLLIDNADDNAIKGFMPRGRKKGFVIESLHPSLESLTRTIAHELGHGAFLLKHTWEEYPEIVPGSTNNLMDYSDGTHLHKYQWDVVHNPPFLGGVFDGDEEGLLNDLVPKFRLLVWSPQISRQLRDALQSGDIVEQRRLTYWALNNPFPDDWALGIGGLNYGDLYQNYAATLKRYSDDLVNFPGLQVVMYGFFTSDGCITDDPEQAVIIKRSEEHRFEFGISNSKVLDEAFPVDIYLHVGFNQVSDGSSFYSDYDFKGYFAESIMFVEGSGVIAGRMRGYGYIEYFVHYDDGFNFVPGLNFGVVVGDFIEDYAQYPDDYPSGATPETFTGTGLAASFGDIGRWVSFIPQTNTPLWIGETYSVPNPLNVISALGLSGFQFPSGGLLVLENFLNLGPSGFATETAILPNFAHQAENSTLFYNCSY